MRADCTLLVESVNDILRAKTEGKMGLIMGFQGASPIQNDLAYLTIFKKLGLRIMGIAYNRRNLCGDGAQASGTNLDPAAASVARVRNCLRSTGIVSSPRRFH